MHFRRKKSLMDRAHDYVEQISETVLPQLESAWDQAVDKAGPALTDAKEKATPILAEGRTLAAEKASIGAALAAEKAAAGREKAAPLIAEGRALAAEKAAAGREVAAARVATLRGEEPEPRGSKLKKVLLLGGLLAIIGVVASKLRSRQDDSANWQSSYVPPAPPATTTPAAPASADTKAATTTAATASAFAAGSDPLNDPLPPEDFADVSADDVVTAEPPAAEDVGGGSPGEAMSDLAKEPHEATTPDSPAEVIDINDVPPKD